MTFRKMICPAVLALLLLSADRAAAGIITVSAAGANAAAITSAVDNFRNILGNPNNGNTPGPLPGGRREINWDGGGQAVTPAGTPFTGFENIRGATFTTPGTGFVQAPPTGPLGGLDTFFGNPTYATIFTTFSAPRLFSPVGSNITDTTFSIPGTGGTVPATVSGFGAVFADVDLANTSSLQFFDIGGNSLGTFFVPTFNNGLSFLGVDFGESIVARVRITTGNNPLGPTDGGNIDVVALDDFFFGEPQGIAVPEPTSLILVGIGGFALVVRRCLKKRKKADE